MEHARSPEARRGRRQKWLSRLGPPLLLFLISVGFFWKIVLTNQYTWLEGPDLSNQVLPWLQMQAGEWHRGRVPLWDPYLWGGQSTIGQMITGAASPFNWILFSLPLKHGWIRQAYLHWYFVLIHFLAAWFGYLLCRDLKRSHAASFVGGCAFALGGWMGSIDWPQMLNSAVWAPLVLMYMLRSLRGVRPMASAAASGAFFGMAFLGSHHQIPVFLMLAAGGIWLYFLLRRGRPDWNVARLAAVFLVFLFLVSALQTLPAYEYGKLSKRWVGAEDAKGWNEPVPYSVHSQYSLIPTSLVSIVIPGYSRHTDPFISLTALTLALLAVGLAWKELYVRLFAAVAVGGLLFSLGRNNVFHGILYALVPMVEKARSPSMAVFIYHFGIAVLTAYAVDSLLPQSDSPWPRRAARALVIFAGIVFAIVIALVVGQKPPGDDRFIVVSLVALLLAGLLHGWRKGSVPQTTAAALALVLMLIEFGNLSGIYWPNREEKSRNVLLPRMAQHADIAKYLLDIPWPVRMEVWEDKDIPYIFGDWYGIDQFGGFVASLPVNLLRLPWNTPRAKQIFGVNFTVKRDPPAPNQVEVFQGSTGLKVYWNKDAFPRVWTVHQAKRVRDESEIQAVMGGGPLDLRRTTFMLTPPPPLEACPPASDSVRLARRNSGRLTIEAEMGCRGMVILGDSYFPGWVAWVDGRRTPIHEAYTAIRGVVVDKGRHTIEMRYLPVSVIAGLILTLLGVGGAVGLTVLARRREQECAGQGHERVVA